MPRLTLRTLLAYIDDTLEPAEARSLGRKVAESEEARRLIEVGVAGLSAARATGEQVAAIAEEVTSMFASLDSPQDFLRHDIRFHQAVAASCGNPILTSLVEMLSQVFYERRRETVSRARNIRESADMHRRIYMAIRQRDSAAAREAMDHHLQRSVEAEASEEGEAAALTLNGAR